MLVVRIWEGLGNQMFQYAFARILQDKVKHNVYLEGRRIYREHLPQEDLTVERKCLLNNFNLEIKFIKPEYLSGWSYLEQRTVFQRIQFAFAEKKIGKYIFLTDYPDMYAYHEELLNLNQNAYIMGHFLSKKYIEPIRKKLLQENKKKNVLVLNKELSLIMQNYDTISLHIRRGDYLYAECAQIVNEEMRKGHYYERAMKYIAGRVNNPFFLIFSDDMEWVQKNFICSYKHIYIKDMGYKDYEEMMLMSYCKHNIIANSTFSFWGAWLNKNKGKKVICPKHWLPSIIPDGWIRM